jgi:methylated-DNA-[protein]-cysteine S-methyltransferase
MTLRNPRCIAQATFDTPLGTLLAAATPKGLAGLWFEGQAHHPGPLALPVDPAHRWIACARQELADYFAGNTAAFTVKARRFSNRYGPRCARLLRAKR